MIISIKLDQLNGMQKDCNVILVDDSPKQIDRTSSYKNMQGIIVNDTFSWKQVIEKVEHKN